MMMLAIDIETLGLFENGTAPEITCVCMYDGQHEYTFQIWQAPDKESKMHQIIHLLDSASHIAGYNAIYFDLEVIRVNFGISAEKMTKWVLKCIDPFMHMKLILQSPCKLQTLLNLNQLESKTGNGLDAISLAKGGQWEALLDYCLTDAKLTHQLCSLQPIRLNSFLILSNFSPPSPLDDEAKFRFAE